MPAVSAAKHTTVVERMAKAPSGTKREEGMRICVEMIERVREIEGVHGVHVMAYRQEELVAEVRSCDSNSAATPVRV